MAKYPDLKTYLQANYKDLLNSEVQKFVDGNYDGGGFHSINVLSLLRHKIENLEVKALTCHEINYLKIRMDVGVQVDIVELGLGTREYEADRKRRWFKISLVGNLVNGLTSVEPVGTEEYHTGKFDPESALDQFLVPYIYSASLEENADDFTDFYCDGADYDGYKLPIKHIFQEFDIKCYLADMPDNCFGRMYFRKATATVYEGDADTGELVPVKKEIEPGTMLISRSKYFLGDDGTQLLTIAHEIIHWHLHRNYFRLLSLLDDQADMMSCEVEPSRYEESMTMAQKAHWYAEWQANALAIRIAMPVALLRKAFAEVSATEDKEQFPGDIVENALRRIAEMFDVPIFAAKQRARQVGIEAADGAFVYVDGKWHEPFVFLNGNLEPKQTYVIDRASYEKLYHNNSDFAELIDSGKYVYLGYVVCINDPKYVAVDFSSGRAELKLTDYAREYANECCLKFDFRSTSYLREMQDKYEFYGESYLSKEVKSENYVEHQYDKNFNLDCLQNAEDLKKQIAVIIEAQDAQDKVMLEMQQKRLTAFADALIYHMDRKHITVDELVERSGLSDTTIKNYRAGKKTPPIENVMAVCIGLNLPKAYSLHLLGTCSYQLGESPRDRAYKVCLDHDDGTLLQWNMILDAFGQPNIPNLRNQKTK